MGKFEWTDLIAAISLVVAIVSVGIVLFQIYRKASRQKAEFLGKLVNQLITDSDINEVAYMIDYGIPWYDSTFHGSGKLEFKVDKTLAYYSYICYLKKRKIISDEEFAFFKYRIHRALNNGMVKNYFYNLYHFSRKQKTPFTFEFLFEYGKLINVYDEAFYCPQSGVNNIGPYKKILNYL